MFRSCGSPDLTRAEGLKAVFAFLRTLMLPSGVIVFTPSESVFLPRVFPRFDLDLTAIARPLLRNLPSFFNGPASFVCVSLKGENASKLEAASFLSFCTEESVEVIAFSEFNRPILCEDSGVGVRTAQLSKESLFIAFMFVRPPLNEDIEYVGV